MSPIQDDPSLKPVVVTSTAAYYPQIITVVHAGDARVSYERREGEDMRVAIERVEIESLKAHSKRVEIPPAARRAADYLGVSRILVTQKANLLIANAGRYRNSNEPGSVLALHGLDDDMVMGHKTPEAIVFATKYDTEAVLVEFDRAAISNRLAGIDPRYSDSELVRAVGSEVPTGPGFETAAACHTLSHALMRSLAGGVGLDLTSVGEHLAVSQFATVHFVKKAYETPMALLEQLDSADVMEEVLRTAVDRLARCPNDPACEKHPQGGCPSCVQVPEICCSSMNRPLNRSKVKLLLLGG